MANDPSRPGATRPGGRTARVRRQVLRSAEDLLVEDGFGHLDLAEVARRAKVGKSTVYRRWGTVAELVADLLDDMAEQSLPRTDEGALLSDLKAQARLVRRTLTDERQKRLFKSLIAAATSDTAAATALRGFYEIRVAEWAPCVEAAIARGEIPEGTDPGEVIRAVSAPLYYRLLITGGDIDAAVADRAAEAAAAAARAGVHMRA